MAKDYDVTEIPEPAISRFFFANTQMSWIWLPLRLYAGWEWVVSGYEKIINPVWVGPKAGVALNGFLMGALKKLVGHIQMSLLVWKFFTECSFT